VIIVKRPMRGRRLAVYLPEVAEQLEPPPGDLHMRRSGDD